MSIVIQMILWLLLLLLSITLHEYMHGWAAYKLGDPTAKNAGRLTLNPLKHIDPFGTVLLPLLLTMANGIVFGYAKPVPVNPRYFKDIRKGDLITGFAGPAANLVLALVGTAVVRAVAVVSPTLSSGWEAANVVGEILVETNLVLMFFNLIPLPPLDGSSIVPMFLSDKALHWWYGVQRYSFGVLLVLMWGVPALTGWSPLSVYFDYTVGPMMNLLLGA